MSWFQQKKKTNYLTLLALPQQKKPNRNVLLMDFVTQSHFSKRKVWFFFFFLKKRKISLPSHTHESRLHEWTPRVVHAQLRPEHHLRSPTATSPAPSTISYPPLRHRGAFRLPRAAAPTLRGAVRASASSAPGAAPSSASSAPGATAPLEVEVAVAHREVARELASRAEARLGPRLLPSAVPPDVAGFRSGGGAGNAVGSLDVRRGAPGSTVMAPSPLSLLFVRTYRFSCACSLEASLPLSISC